MLSDDFFLSNMLLKTKALSLRRVGAVSPGRVATRDRIRPFVLGNSSMVF